MKTITCDKCGKKLNFEKDIVTISEIDCLSEIIKEIIVNKTNIEWTR